MKQSTAIRLTPADFDRAGLIMTDHTTHRLQRELAEISTDARVQLTTEEVAIFVSNRDLITAASHLRRQGLL